MEILSAPTILHLLENKKDSSRSKYICEIKSSKFRNDFTVDQQNVPENLIQNGWCVDVVNREGLTTCTLKEKNDF